MKTDRSLRLVYRRRRSRRRWVRSCVIVVSVILLLAWTLIPLLWMLSTSLKTNAELYTKPGLLPNVVTGAQYVTLLFHSGFLTYIRNTVMIAVLASAVSIVIGVCAGYALMRLRFRGRLALVNATIISYLMPASLLFIPLFQVAYELHLTNHLLALVPVYLIFSAPFCTWLAMGAMVSIPESLEDAALVDGATRLQTLARIVVPLILPSIAAIGVLTFLLSWNEFLYPLILISSDSSQVLTVGLANFVVGDFFQWGPLMAGSLLATVPPVVLSLISQRWLVTGLTAGATKG